LHRRSLATAAALAALKVTASLPAASPASALLLANAYIYTTNANAVTAYDTSTGSTTATIPVGSTPYDVAITPNGYQAYRDQQRFQHRVGD
jgi:YVTN family beta-propeller protein